MRREAAILLPLRHPGRRRSQTTRLPCRKCLVPVETEAKDPKHVLCADCRRKHVRKPAIGVQCRKPTEDEARAMAEVRSARLGILAAERLIDDWITGRR